MCYSFREWQNPALSSFAAETSSMCQLYQLLGAICYMLLSRLLQPHISLAAQNLQDLFNIQISVSAFINARHLTHFSHKQMQVPITAVVFLSSGALIAKIHIKKRIFANESGVNFSPEVRRNIGRFLGEVAACYSQVHFLAFPAFLKKKKKCDAVGFYLCQPHGQLKLCKSKYD